MNSIELHRRLRGLTQRQLGERIGIDHTLVSRYETGGRKVTAGHAVLLSNALGIPVDALQDEVVAVPAETTTTIDTTTREVLRTVTHV